MKRPRPDDSDSSVSFLDVIACAFGAIALLVLMLPIGEWGPAPEAEAPPTADYGRMLFTLAGLREEVAALRREVAENDRLGVEASTDLASAQAVSRRLESLVERTRAESNRLRRRSAAIAASQKILDQAPAAADEQELEVDTELAGIPVDSEYIAFVVDTSGSVTGDVFGLLAGMPSIWDRVVEEIGNILSIYPRVRGFQVLNDQGTYLYGGGNRRWIPDSPSNRRRALNRMQNWRPFSGSNPAPGIRTAIRDLYASDRKMAIFVVGDEYQSDDFDGFLDAVDSSVARRDVGRGALRIHAIGFWNQGLEQGFGGGYFAASTRNFAILMRELTHRHQGAFLALPATAPPPRVAIARTGAILHQD